MLTTSEQQELYQIGQGLRDTDRGFAWCLTLFQGMLCWAAPGRQAYLLALAVLAATLLRLIAALLRLVAATGRLLMAFAEGAMVLGDTAWPGRDSGQAPGHSSSPAQDRPQSDDTDLP
ncbi:MAG: hypothetical protein ACRDND_13240 [Streptosporangiaceae bacterium]